MIKLTRYKGGEFRLNPDLIETIEETPDTVVTLVDGKKVIVVETADDIAQRVVVHRATILSIVTRLEAETTAEEGAGR